MLSNRENVNVQQSVEEILLEMMGGDVNSNHPLWSAYVAAIEERELRAELIYSVLAGVNHLESVLRGTNFVNHAAAKGAKLILQKLYGEERRIIEYQG